jgi:mono/diheme cytochrome c family protein
LHDEWGNQLKPRNLTLGQYRGGRRPVDLFRRVYAGIKGTPMPAFGGTALKDNEIWDLVNYVMSLPYASRQPSSAPAATGHMANVEEKPAK